LPDQRDPDPELLAHHVLQLQDAQILDTIEITDLPEVICAAPKTWPTLWSALKTLSSGSKGSEAAMNEKPASKAATAATTRGSATPLAWNAKSAGGYMTRAKATRSGRSSPARRSRHCRSIGVARTAMAMPSSSW
jgi:hypothetical protein